MVLEDDEEGAVDCYLWERGSNFAQGFIDENFRSEAERIEDIAGEESHNICYLIPDLGLGGTISSAIHIVESLATLSEKQGVQISTVASDEFAFKYKPIMEFSVGTGDLDINRVLH